MTSLSGRHVLTLVLAFFATVIAVNGAFIYTALNTFPGEDVRRSYLQGLNYNQTLAARRAQAALDWRVQAMLAASDGGASVEVRFSDRNGAPIDGLAVEGVLRRPADSDQDQPLIFTPRGAGVYTARIASLAAGAWDIRATAQRGSAEFSFVRREMWTPPS